MSEQDMHELKSLIMRVGFRALVKELIKWPEWKTLMGEMEKGENHVSKQVA